MLKKNSWIVALFLALSFTALLAGCVDAVVEAVDNTVYTEVPLGKFNTWGGQTYQKGWAVADLTVTDPDHVTADLGYKNSDFVGARYLQIEMPDDSYPKGGIDIIWGADDPELGGWNQNPVSVGGNAKKDGNVLKIDLTKALKNYAKFKTGAKVRIVIQYNQPGGVEGLVQKAALLVPDSVPYKSITDIALKNTAAGYTFFPKLLAVEFTPDDATNQIVNWSIISWTPEGDTVGGGTTLSLPASSSDPGYAAAKAALLAKVAFAPKKLTLRPAPAYNYTDWSVLPPAVVTVANNVDTGQTYIWHESDQIIAKQAGTVVVRATIVDGKRLPGDLNYGQYTNVTKDFAFTVKDRDPFDITVAGTTQTVVFYNTVDNGDLGSTIAPNDDGNGYTVDLKGGYSNALYFFRVDLGSDTLADYVDTTNNTKTGSINFNFVGVSGDFANKDHIRVVLLDPETPGELSGYQPLYWLALSKTGTGNQDAGVVPFSVKLGFDQRSNDANLAPSSAKGNAFTKLGSKSVIYVCIYLNSNPAAFKITDIELVKKTP